MIDFDVSCYVDSVRTLIRPYEIVDLALKESKLIFECRYPREILPRCAKCKRLASPCGYRKRRVRNVDVEDYIVEILVANPRSRCERHGVRLIETNWVISGSKFTKAFEAWALNHLISTNTSLRDFARTFRISTTAAQKLLKRRATNISIAQDE
jgi:transposase